MVCLEYIIYDYIRVLKFDYKCNYVFFLGGGGGGNNAYEGVSKSFEPQAFSPFR